MAEKKNGEGCGFVESVESFEPGDGGAAKKKIKKTRPVNVIYVVLLCICAAALIVCGVKIAMNLIDKHKGKEIYDDAASLFVPSSMFLSDSENDADPEQGKISDNIDGIHSDDKSGGSKKGIDMNNVIASLGALKEVNNDVVGWIYVENTTINYPLLRSSTGDDDYYLNHAYNGEYLSVGSIYMVSACDEKFENNYNTLISGHNLVSGGMFHDVGKFFDPSFFTTKIYIFTLDGVYVFQPFSVYKTQSDYYYIRTDFQSESDFLNFASEMKSNSEIYSDVSIGEGDRMLTLSTCTGTGVVSTARYTLQAKLVEVMN